MTAEEQSADAKAEIRIKLLDNGVLVKVGPSWMAFTTWELASHYVGARIKALEKKRQESPR